MIQHIDMRWVNAVTKWLQNSEFTRHKKPHNAVRLIKHGVADGARTHDNRNHNPGLYQLSYNHHWNKNMVCPTGIEPVTPSLEGWCSIRLSYGQMGYTLKTQKSCKKGRPKILVGVERFELPTSCSQSRRATRLRYTPKRQKYSANRAFGQFEYVKIVFYFLYLFEL